MTLSQLRHQASDVSSYVYFLASVKRMAMPLAIFATSQYYNTNIGRDSSCFQRKTTSDIL